MENEIDYKIRTKGYTTTTSKAPTIPQGRDTFETPYYATDLLIPFIPLTVEKIWEPAAGSGKIASRLKATGFCVVRSDIRTFDGRNEYRNFLDDSPIPDGVDAIITNPPYSLKAKFIDKAMEIGLPFAFLINADYSGQQIKWILSYGCEKIIPNRRIDFITPTGRNGKTSASQFHSMWLTHGFELGRTETFIELSLLDKKETI